MPTDLKGRRILVTGAASGIGRAVARMLVREGAHVAWLDRDGEGLRAAAGDSAIAVVADQTRADEVQAAVDRAAEGLGGLDGLVNAAGIADTSSAADISLDRWNAVLAVNLTGPFLLSRAARPHLLRGTAPAIVNVASASGILPSASGAAYASSKAGVLMLTKSLAAEWAPDIRVNAVCPGTVDTPMLDGLFSRDEKFAERIRQGYALQRMAQPEEIAEAIMFLVSPRASFVTGISMAVDGGRTFH